MFRWYEQKQAVLLFLLSTTSLPVCASDIYTYSLAIGSACIGGMLSGYVSKCVERSYEKERERVQRTIAQARGICVQSQQKLPPIVADQEISQDEREEIDQHLTRTEQEIYRNCSNLRTTFNQLKHTMNDTKHVCNGAVAQQQHVRCIDEQLNQISRCINQQISPRFQLRNEVIGVPTQCYALSTSIKKYRRFLLQHMRDADKYAVDAKCKQIFRYIELLETYVHAINYEVATRDTLCEVYDRSKAIKKAARQMNELSQSTRSELAPLQTSQPMPWYSCWLSRGAIAWG